MNTEDSFHSDELLLHRFLDDDLDPLERLAFFEALDRSPELRKQLVVHERLIGEVRHLPRPPVPMRFKADVLAKLPSPSSSWWATIQERFFRSYTLHWNPAMAFALSVVLVGGIFLFQSPSVTPPPSPVVTTNVMPVSNQESRVLVQFMYLQPQAQSVAVAGDFNGWQPDPTVFRKTEDGVWTATLQMKPGRYHYMFVVDENEWVSDPLATEYSLDGFGSQNAVLDVSQVM